VVKLVIERGHFAENLNRSRMLTAPFQQLRQCERDGAVAGREPPRLVDVRTRLIVLAKKLECGRSADKNLRAKPQHGSRTHKFKGARKALLGLLERHLANRCHRSTLGVDLVQFLAKEVGTQGDPGAWIHWRCSSR
jgi:hypothetical protein